MRCSAKTSCRQVAEWDITIITEKGVEVILFDQCFYHVNQSALNAMIDKAREVKVTPRRGAQP